MEQRGGVLVMADSKGSKAAAKESGNGQRVTELVVHRALGINSKAPKEDNLSRECSHLRRYRGLA